MPVSFSLFETMLAFYCRLAVPCLTGGGEVSGKLMPTSGRRRVPPHPSVSLRQSLSVSSMEENLNSLLGIELAV